MVIGIIQIIIAIITLAVTIYIPVLIMHVQTYQSLMSDYRGTDFAAAVQGVIEFFTVECEGKTENIAEKYKERFLRDIYGEKTAKMMNYKASMADLKKYYRKYSGEVKFTQKDPSVCLHYQRRLLAQFFNQLDWCARLPFYRRRVQKDFTRNEAKMIRILMAMNEEIDSDEILKKDLSCDFRVRPEKSVKGLNNYLAHLYHLLNKSKPFMQI